MSSTLVVVAGVVAEVVVASIYVPVGRWVDDRSQVSCVAPAGRYQQIPSSTMRVHTSLLNWATSCSRMWIRCLSRSRSSSICSRSSAEVPSSSRFSAVLWDCRAFTSSHSFPRTSYSVVVSPRSRQNGGSTTFRFPFALAESLGGDGASSTSGG